MCFCGGWCRYKEHAMVMGDTARALTKAYQDERIKAQK
jgi:hypothetical protein